MAVRGVKSRGFWLSKSIHARQTASAPVTLSITCSNLPPASVRDSQYDLGISIKVPNSEAAATDTRLPTNHVKTNSVRSKPNDALNTTVSTRAELSPVDSDAATIRSSNRTLSHSVRHPILDENNGPSLTAGSQRASFLECAQRQRGWPVWGRLPTNRFFCDHRDFPPFSIRPHCRRSFVDSRYPKTAERIGINVRLG